MHTQQKQGPQGKHTSTHTPPRQEESFVAEDSPEQ